MATCISCGSNVSGKKFCPECGTPVQHPGGQVNNSAMTQCPRCHGEIKVGAAFCMHCGGSLQVQAQPVARVTAPQAIAPAIRVCSACQSQVPATSAFCNNCGHDMRAVTMQPGPQATGPAFCTHCGRQNDPGVHFCGGCGGALGSTMQNGYAQTGQSMPGAYTNYSSGNPGYTGQGQYAQTGYTPSQLDQSPYAQTPYPQNQSPQTYQSGQYPQPAQMSQVGYQPQPMLGQQPMVLRCPTCMAMSPMGTPYCRGCRTSLAGVVPTPANMPVPGQQQGGGFLQGNAGKYAIGALGGVAAVLGGQMLLNGIEDNIADRVEDNLRGGHHHDGHDGGGLLDLADDIGLF